MIGTTWECADLPTWPATACCPGCHDSASDVRPTRVSWPAGYPVGASSLVLAAGAHRVLCCRAQLHATIGMGGQGAFLADTLGLIGPPVPVGP